MHAPQQTVDSIRQGAPQPFGGMPGLVSPEPRSARTAFDVVALVLAVVVAPLGLIAGIVAAILSSRRLNYVNGVAKTAIVIALVLTTVGAAGGVLAAVAVQSGARDDAVRAESAAMCAVIAQRPTVLSDAAFGWPAADSTIPAYAAAVASYEQWWTSVAKAAPAPMKGQAQRVATAARSASERTIASRMVDHDRDYSDMRAIAAASALPAWVASYCD